MIIDVNLKMLWFLPDLIKIVRNLDGIDTGLNFLVW